MNIKPLSWWRHKKSGAEYQVIIVTNENCTKESFITTVVYVDTKSKPYSRVASEWIETFELIENASVDFSSSMICDAVTITALNQQNVKFEVRYICNQFQRIIEDLEDKVCVSYRSKGSALSRVGSDDKDWTLSLGSLMMPKHFVTSDSIANTITKAISELSKTTEISGDEVSPTAVLLDNECTHVNHHEPCTPRSGNKLSDINKDEGYRVGGGNV